jgi:CubicO group peptidase (beta-lactamase class C family)
MGHVTAVALLALLASCTTATQPPPNEMQPDSGPILQPDQAVTPDAHVQLDSAAPSPDSGPGVSNTPPVVTTQNELKTVLPKAAKMLTSTKGSGQLYVSLDGKVIANYAWGSYDTQTLVPWASATKPSTGVAFMRLVEEGLVSLDDPVSKHIAGFEVKGKAGVLIRHLLTHAAHLSGYAGPTAKKEWDQVIADIVAAPLAWERGAPPNVDKTKPPIPGEHPAYNPPSLWILGEILRLERNKPFDRIIRDEMYLLAGMSDSFNGMTDPELAQYKDRIPPVVDGAKPDRHWANPAGGTIGPSWQLGRFYEVVLLGKGRYDNTDILSAATIADMVKRQSGPEGRVLLGADLRAQLLGADDATLRQRAIT